MTRLALVALSGLAIGSALWAHENATGVVKKRMETMERFEELIERVFAMINGELRYDAAAVERAAEEIRAGSGKHLTALFPEGSGGPPSEARAEIWRDEARFRQWAIMLEGWSGELAERAGQRPRGNLPTKWEEAEMGPRMMLGGGMGRRGGPDFAAWHMAVACNACHAEFRMDD